MQFFNKPKKILEEEVAPLTPAQVEHLLRTAKPAERCDSYFPPGAGAEEVEFPHLFKDERRHGIWVCCCGHDNQLVHFEGPHPFKKLTCGDCDKILCKNCLTTDIVIPLKDADQATIAKQDMSKLRGLAEKLFQICPDCGLSTCAQIRNPDHHGERLCWVPVASHSHSEMCPCGASAKSNWLKFVIGDPSTYRSNPAKALDDLKNIWMKKKALKSGYQLEHIDSVQKSPKSKWEEPGYRGAQVVKTPLKPHDSLKEFVAHPYTHTFPDSRHAGILRLSQPVDRSVQNTPVPSPIRPSIRLRPAHLTLVQHESSIKRSGAVRSNGTPRSGSTSTPRSGSYPETPTTARPQVLPRAETWATATQHQRAHKEGTHERSYFDPSEGIPPYAQPPTPFDLMDEEDLSTSPVMQHTPQFARKPSTMTMHAPQPMRQIAPDGPLFRHKSVTGDVQHQPLAPRHTIVSSQGVIKEANWSDCEPTSRQSQFQVQTELAPAVPEEKDWSNTRRSMEENVKKFLSGTPVSSVFESTDKLKLTEVKKTEEKREEDPLKYTKSYYKIKVSEDKENEEKKRAEKNPLETLWEFEKSKGRMR